MKWLPAYVRASALVQLQYRAAIFARLGVALVWLLLLTRVWTAVYHGRSTLGGLDLHTTVVYLTLANLQGMILNSPLSYVMANRVRTGEVLFDVQRPVGFLRQMLATEAGTSIVQVGLSVLALPAAALVGGLSLPAGPVAGVGYLVSLALGWVLNSLISVLVGLSAFWTVDNMGFAVLFRFVAAFLAGTSVPLVLFPGPLRVVAEALPFRFIVYQPAAVYIGAVRGWALVGGLALALAWTAGMAALAVLVWRRAYRNLVIHGG
jgi:ABC-2 type transport system permease protein